MSTPITNGWGSLMPPVTGTSGTTGVAPCNIYYRRHCIVGTYTSSEIEASIGGTSATFSKLRFYVAQQPTNQPLPNYAIGMKYTSLEQASNSSASRGGALFTTVFPQTSTSFATGTYEEFTFSTTFAWTSGNNVAIAFAWGQCPTNYSSTGKNQIGTGTVYQAQTDDAGTYLVTDSCPSSVRYRTSIQLYVS
jgi:hypothetical protein